LHFITFHYIHSVLILGNSFQIRCTCVAAIARWHTASVYDPPHVAGCVLTYRELRRAFEPICTNRGFFVRIWRSKWTERKSIYKFRTCLFKYNAIVQVTFNQSIPPLHTTRSDQAQLYFLTVFLDFRPFIHVQYLTQPWFCYCPWYLVRPQIVGSVELYVSKSSAVITLERSFLLFYVQARLQQSCRFEEHNHRLVGINK
jgi:hypothetical protein